MLQMLESWPSAPGSVELSEGEAHVWCASLDQTTQRVEEFWQVLSQKEREKALRFHFEKDRRDFTVARGTLREILGRYYLRCTPAQVEFSYNSFGKPALAGADTADQRGALRFNVSHSHGIALYAMTRGREVGLDVEWLRDDFASEEIARQFFSAREVEMLRALPFELRTSGFFNCWTRKEAYIKALGEGLSHPLDRFAVTLAPGEPARFLSIDDDTLEAERWSMIELHPEKGYAAALVLEGASPALRCWRYD
jgi:4'-phosphopantetheinyl transferase